MMKRRVFISLFNSIWVLILGFFPNQKKTTQVLPDSTRNKTEVSNHVVLNSSERFKLPADAKNGFSVKVSVYALTQPAVISSQGWHSIEQQANEIEMDVAGTYIFTFSEEGSFWAVEKIYAQDIPSSLA